MSDPPYSHVSDPERFRPLHRHARLLVERLSSLYDVEAHDDDPDLGNDPETPGGPAVEVHRLQPAGGGPGLTVALTAFPGLVVRLGTEAQTVPVCGCDGCNDDVAELFAGLEHDVHRFTRGWPRRPGQVSTATSVIAFRTLLAPGEVVREHVAAFNAHDTDRLLAGLTPHAQWITGQDRLDGHHALRELFDDGLWSLDPSLSIEAMVEDGDLVAAQLTERITVEDEVRTYPIAVFFELDLGRIRRVKVYREGRADL